MVLVYFPFYILLPKGFWVSSAPGLPSAGSFDDTNEVLRPAVGTKAPPVLVLERIGPSTLVPKKKREKDDPTYKFYHEWVGWFMFALDKVFCFGFLL